MKQNRMEGTETNLNGAKPNIRSGNDTNLAVFGSKTEKPTPLPAAFNAVLACSKPLQKLTLLNKVRKVDGLTVDAV